MVKCSISQCNEEAKETVKTVIVNPNQPSPVNHDLKICEKHAKILNLSNPTNVSIRSSVVKEANEKADKNLPKFQW